MYGFKKNTDGCDLCECNWEPVSENIPCSEVKRKRGKSKYLKMIYFYNRELHVKVLVYVI
jgi:hypothetical protein